MRKTSWIGAAAIVIGVLGCAPGDDTTGLTAGEVGARRGAGASSRPGMGANVYDGGATFRVWAPNAERVFVAGDFNQWSESATELAAEGNGNFSADVPGVAAGAQYQYVLVRGGRSQRRADPRARQMTNSVGNSVVVDPAAYTWTAQDYRTPRADETVIYEMHVGTFNDAPGGGPGTFASATERLDHLRELGINMIELMPAAEFPGDFSWGYNPSEPFAPESAYGTPDELRRFVDAAHARGIGVMMDVVHNHWGPSDLPMWCFDLECYGAGGAYFYSDWRGSTPWGSRPDYGRAEVRDYIRDNAMMWLDEYRMDGLRWDSTSNIRQANGSDLSDGWRVLQQANDAVHGAEPWKLMVAEDLQNNDWLTRGTGGGGAGFDSQWDAGFFHPIDDAIIRGDDAGRSMYAVRDAIAHGYNGAALARVIYTESHDEVANGRQRIPEMIWPGHADSYFSRKRSTLGAAIVMTAPGIPMIFQGQELLTDGYFTDQNPLDWSRAQAQSGIVQLYRDLIHLRRNWQDNTRGLRGGNVNVFHVNDGDKVLAFHRWDQGGAGDDVVVIANFSNRRFDSYTTGFPRGGVWRVRFNSDWTGYSSDFGNTPSLDTTAVAGGRDGLGYNGSVAIGPYSVVILSQ